MKGKIGRKKEGKKGSGMVEVGREIVREEGEKDKEEEKELRNCRRRKRDSKGGRGRE
jgi:hypothetical protein